MRKVGFQNYELRFRDAVKDVVDQFDWSLISLLAQRIVGVREAGGRIFVLGLGGSAGNAGHMVNDLRKIAGVQAYAPTDNVSELTARINDDGWGQSFAGWLGVSNLSSRDAIFVLSVGGGNVDMGVSLELVSAVDFAMERGAQILGIVGRDGGYVGRRGDLVAVVPSVEPALVTPLAESFQAVFWHAIVTHPALALSQAHWESLDAS